MKNGNPIFGRRSALLTALALLICTVALPSCDDDGDPKFGERITLEITVEELSSTTASILIVPSAEDARYFARLYPADKVEVREDQQDKIDNILWTMCLGERDFDRTLYTGRQTLPFDRLLPGQTYYVLAFGHDALTGVTSELYRTTRFTTPASPATEE